MNILEEIEALSTRHELERQELYKRLETLQRKEETVQEGDVWLWRGDVLRVERIVSFREIDVYDMLINTCDKLTEYQLTNRGMLLYRSKFMTPKTQEES